MNKLFPTLMVAVFLLFGFAGCGDKKDDANPISAKDDYYLPVIYPSNFVDSISNPYWPMTPGRTWKYEGTDNKVNETIDVEVLSETKTVMGVTCTVIRDRAYEDGSLVEDTQDWYAQDKQGHIWYMGEDVKNIEDGKVVDTKGSWEAGVDGAQPGIFMWANPFPGAPYRQEYYAGEAEDWGQVIDILDSVTINSGTYYNVVKVKEWTPLEPGLEEHNYYAPDVGLIKEEVVSGGSGIVELKGMYEVD